MKELPPLKSSTRRTTVFDECEYETTVFMSYRTTQFLNMNYLMNVEEDYINSSKGFSFTLRVPLFSNFAFDISPYSNLFTVSDSSFDTVDHSGVEAYLDMYVLPYLGQISYIISPFVGIGYQTSSLSVTKNEKTVYSVGTGAPIYQAGLEISLDYIHINAVYKQTFPTSSAKLFRAFEAGIGISF